MSLRIFNRKPKLEERLAQAVNAYGGSMVIMTDRPLAIGHRDEEFGTTDKAGVEVRQPYTVIQRVTRKEYLAFPWPEGHAEEFGLTPFYYYEVVFD